MGMGKEEMGGVVFMDKASEYRPGGNLKKKKKKNGKMVWRQS